MQPGALQNVLSNLTRLQRKVHDEVVIKYDKIDNVSYNPGDASTMFKQAYEGSASLTCVCLRPDPLLCSIESQGGLTFLLILDVEIPLQHVDWMTSPDSFCGALVAPLL